MWVDATEKIVLPNLLTILKQRVSLDACHQTKSDPFNTTFYEGCKSNMLLNLHDWCWMPLRQQV